MREVITELTLDAPRPQVWNALLDKASWHHYSAFVDRDPGTPIAEGQSFRFGLRFLGLPPVPVTGHVLRCTLQAELRWVGLGPGFRGEHYFVLEEAGEATTRLVHGEAFSGPIGEAFCLIFHRQVTETYGAFNRGLAGWVRGS
jgi:hypothetical protein